MIKQVDITESFNADNLFLIKIKANSLCYKDYEFCKTFFEEQNGEICAYINILGESATIFSKENADENEIKAFLLFNNIKNVFCNRGFSLKSQGVILKHNLKNTVGINFNNQNKFNIKKAFFPDFKSAFLILKDEFFMPDYNDFVSDLSFRIKNNSARFFQAEGAVAFTLWETDSQAVISAIAVEKSKRKNGLGTKLLQSIVNDILKENKEIYVYCEEKNKDFYIQNGFLQTEKFYTGELN